MKFGLYKIKGNSMLPSYHAGDFVLTFRRQNNTFKVGDVVIVNHPILNIVLKRIYSIENNAEYRLAGDNLQESISTESLGQINDEEILGRVFWHIKGRGAKNKIWRLQNLFVKSS